MSASGISREFEKDGQRYFYRVAPLATKGHFAAELRILREEKALGDVIFAQPQLVAYKGPGTLEGIDKTIRAEAERLYGIKIPK